MAWRIVLAWVFLRLSLAAGEAPGSEGTGAEVAAEPAIEVVDEAGEEGEAGEPDDKKDPARLTVKGLGWLQNLQMKSVLRQLRPAREAPPVYDANAIEDGAFLLLNHAHRLGYLRASVTSQLTLAGGRTLSVVWRDDELPPLPRPMAAVEVRYWVDPGLRYFYEDLTFHGLTAISHDSARHYFVRTDGLLQTRGLRRFSAAELDDAVEALKRALIGAGYARATVQATPPEIDHARGAVRVEVHVDQGPIHRVRELRLTVRENAGDPPTSEEVRPVDRILTRQWREDLEQELLVKWFRDGYPDANATVNLGPETVTAGSETVVNLDVEVIHGPRVRLGTPRFTGPAAEQLSEGLRRRVRLEGPWLDRLEVDEVRSKLARLGGFRFINVDYLPSETDPGARDPVFELEPGRNLTVDVLAGFRSYELLYGGVDIVRRNLFGVGHSAELRMIQSFRSTEATATYSIPDALAEDVTIYGLLDFLTREEVSFRREEFRTSVGVRRNFEGSGHQIGARYNFELLRAVDAPENVPNRSGDDDQPLVSSIVLDWDLERRDSAMVPRRGYHVAAAFEFAVPELGGEARFLRPEVAASGHLPLGNGRYVHAGVRYTLVTDPGNEGLVPFNKRIFPGGEDSVRGYQRGEAAPLNANGEEIGAETALEWNLEFEQLLTPSWSLVAFVDGVAQSADLQSQFPWDEVLWSVGGGIRWNTAIGPVRLEYGHNLNPREPDPSGTVHFSIGFPF